MERQKRKKSIRSRILALTLAILTAFTALPSQTAYADSVGGNVSGGGTGGMGASSDAKAWSSNDQGYRFYLVDENFNRVTDVYDFVFSTPNAGEYLSATRFDSSSSPSGRHLMTISELARLTQQKVTSIPKPVQNNKGQGVEFKEWFLKNSTGSGGIINSGSSGSNKGHTGSSSGSHTGGSSSGSSSSGSTKEYNTYMDLPQELRDSITDSYPILKSDPSYYAPGLKDLKPNQLKATLESELNVASAMYLEYARIFAKTYNATNKILTTDMIKRAAAMYTLNRLGASDGTNKFVVNYTYCNVSINSVVKQPSQQESLLTQSIPLAKPDTEYTDNSTEGCPAL